MTFPLDRYIADGVRRVKADPHGDLVWFTDAEFNERQARQQAIRDCIAAVNADGWGNSIPLGMSEAMFASAVKDKFLYALKDLLAREQSIPRALLEGENK